MNTEERDLITRFIQRVGGAAAPASGFGSVPTTQSTPPLPPIDREADALIGELFARYPEARYRITQLAFVQEHALVEAQNRIDQLQWQLNQLQQQQAAAPTQPPSQPPSPWGQAAQQPQAAPQPSRGLFGGLFGANRQAEPAPMPQQYAPQPYNQPPQPQYAPGYQPGMFQNRGSGFLGSALTTAAGVAGGMVAGHALMNMFSGGAGHAQSAISDPTGGALPWTPDPNAGPGTGHVQDTGAWTPVENNAGWSNNTSDPGWSDPGTDAGTDPGTDSGWTDASSDDGGWSDPDQG